MKKITTILALTAVIAAYIPSQANASNIVTTSTKSATAPTVLNDDIGQTAFGSISDGSGLQAGSFADLFDGSIGGTTGVDMKARFNANAAFTLNFDLTDHPDGVDIASITTVAGWDNASGGRSNQGYGIELFFVDGIKPSEIFIAKDTWELNDPAEVWTTVTHASNDGSALDSGLTYTNFEGDLVPLTATGVSSIRFFGFDGANAGGAGGGRTNWHEIDIVAVPEPSTILLLLSAVGVLWIRRNRLKGL